MTKRGPGPPKGNRNSLTHGGYSLLAVMNGKGKIDGRTRLGRALKQHRDHLARDLGAGRFEDLSRQQQILVKRVIYKDMILDSIDHYVEEVGPFSAKGQLRPVLRKNYLSWSNSVRLDLMALGLARQARDMTPTLAEIRQRYAGSEGEP